MDRLFPKLTADYENLREVDPVKLSEQDVALRGRYEDIENYFSGDWALHGTNWVREKYMDPMQELLVRLPQDAFDALTEQTNFYFEDPQIATLGVNIQNSQFRRSSHGEMSACFTIVIFKSAASLSPQATTGLLAHEFAHSFVDVFNHSESERLTNEKLSEWGLDPFYQQMLREIGQHGDRQICQTAMQSPQHISVQDHHRRPSES